MKIEHLMATDVRTCRPSDPLSTAAQSMWDGDCGVVVVCDGEGHVVGMVTDRDACMAAHLRGSPLWALTVADAMAKVVYACKPGDKLAKAIALMEQHQVRRLPVVDEAGKLVGLVTLGALAQAAAGKGKKKGGISAREVGEVLAAVTAPREPLVLARAVIEVHRAKAPDAPVEAASKAVLKPKARGSKKPVGARA